MIERARQIAPMDSAGNEELRASETPRELGQAVGEVTVHALISAGDEGGRRAVIDGLNEKLSDVNVAVVEKPTDGEDTGLQEREEKRGAYSRRTRSAVEHDVAVLMRNPNLSRARVRRRLSPRSDT